MNILIVTPFYKHDKNIASVRWTNISLRLSKKHHVIVVTQPIDDMDEKVEIVTEDNVIVARVNQKTRYEKIAVKRFSGSTGDDWQTSSVTNDETNDNIVRKIKNRLYYLSMKVKAKEYANLICKRVLQGEPRIDVVISSACPFIEMLFGYELKKKLNCKWISDFRDLPYIVDESDDTHIMRYFMVSRLKSADAIITIADKGKRILSTITDSPEKIYVIRNGFSLSDYVEATINNDGVLHIVHTGSLYGGKRNADLFFEAVSRIKENYPEFQYVFECAGGNNLSLLNSAKKYSEELNVIDKGFVSRDKALRMQREADLLLAVVNNRPGSFAAKLYEYFLNKKPVVCITYSDDSENSEETEYINKLKLGIAVESSDKNAVSELCDYLIMQWKLKIAGSMLYYEPDYVALKQFDHDNIVVQIEELCSHVVQLKDML